MRGPTARRHSRRAIGNFFLANRFSPARSSTSSMASGASRFFPHRRFAGDMRRRCYHREELGMPSPPSAPPAAPRGAMDVKQGSIIADKYRVERTLGRGGFGIVVRAIHLTLDQPVAIKILTEGAEDSDQGW